MSALVPCPGCNRHVKADETTCPFCQAAVARGTSDAAPDAKK
jgi:endogenous inhibitor of DNA gyrase (YacG/DUF329 family)